MLTVVERVLLFARTPLGDAPTAALARLATIADEHELDEGEALWQLEDEAKELHVLVHGELSLRDQAGRELMRARAGELVDLLPVLRGGERAVTAVATEPSLVLCIAREELWTLLGEEAELSRGLLVATARAV